MKHLLILLILTAALTACKKESANPEQLPPATTTGANTAGCYVDGKLWIARKSNNYDIVGSRFNNAIDGGAAAISETDSTDRNYIWMWFSDRINRGVVTICLDSIPKIGQTFICNKATCPRPACLEFINYASYSDASGFYMTDSIATGSVTFTQVKTVYPNDPDYQGYSRYLFSGYFSFKARNSNNKYKTITDGRFDFVQGF